MAQLCPPGQVKTFSIGFEDKSFDESAHARGVARYLGTDHHEQILQSRALVEMLPEVAGWLDEPLGDASLIPTYLLSGFTRRHVTVALGGDGGDELFAGYPTFAAHRLAQFYKMPAFLHERVVRPLAELLPVSRDNFSFDFKVKRFLRGALERPEIRDHVWIGSFTPEEQRELLNGGTGEIAGYGDIIEAADRCGSTNVLERLSYLYFKFYLQDCVLAKVDRATMACSLEARAPFLDWEFVDFANSIPFDLKLRGLTTKHILKKAMRGLLPPEILYRGKKGFGMPVGKWLRGDLHPLAQELFSEQRLRRQGVFNPRTVTRLLEEHVLGRKDHRKKLWTLLIFQLWMDRYLENTNGRSAAL